MTPSERTVARRGCDSFRKNLAIGIEPNRGRLRENVERFLMLVTGEHLDEWVRAEKIVGRKAK